MGPVLWCFVAGPLAALLNSAADSGRVSGLGFRVYFGFRI